MVAFSALMLLVKTEWWGAGMVICLRQGADVHMAQLMPLQLIVSCFSKILLSLFSYPYSLTKFRG